MAIRQPLVLGADGLPQQLQGGDAISSAVSATTVRPVTNSDSVSLPIGTPVYMFGADSVKRAQANAKTTGQVAGLMFDATVAAAGVGNLISDGILVATTVQFDAVAGTTGGLVFGTRYFLDPATPGKITSTVPTTGGQVNTLIGIALSTTELDLTIQPPILL